MEPVISTSLVGEVITATTTALGLFEVFPLNVMVIGGIIYMGINLVRGFIPKKK